MDEIVPMTASVLFNHRSRENICNLSSAVFNKNKFGSFIVD
ncbi:hypothetical protein FHS16_003889 [Paenibacillus endophyticus]|uniref:Uncharacterized protein n=1 Tax=Paenibacillus endophyticus TaxID=1294268 RepID=A0A7W5CBM4_9BACL|nr:hypothetical protein [Paenibacillus endophyticus]